LKYWNEIWYFCPIKHIKIPCFVENICAIIM
jgi:hypothetical protein